MEREAMSQLEAWMTSSNRKPLIVRGARQVGKTWLVREFAHRNFGALAHIVFLENEVMRAVFNGSLDPDRLLTAIGAYTGTNPLDGNTLVFLDEVQECPELSRHSRCCVSSGQRCLWWLQALFLASH